MAEYIPGGPTNVVAPDFGRHHAKVFFNPPFFTRCTYPHGRLPPIREAQALWFYYGLAVSAWSKIGNVQLYEGEPDYEPDFKKLMAAAATAYGVEVPMTWIYWPYVDDEIDRQNGFRSVLSVHEALQKKLVKLPEKYRFRDVPKLRRI